MLKAFLHLLQKHYMARSNYKPKTGCKLLKVKKVVTPLRGEKKRGEKKREKIIGNYLYILRNTN